MAYFGTNHMGTDDDPWDFLDAAPKIPDPLPLTDTDTETEVGSIQSAPAASGSTSVVVGGESVGVGAKAKVLTKSRQKPLVAQYKDELQDVCAPTKAIQMYPASDKTLNETREPTSGERAQNHTLWGINLLVLPPSLPRETISRPIPGWPLQSCMMKALGHRSRLPVLPMETLLELQRVAFPHGWPSQNSSLVWLSSL